MNPLVPGLSKSGKMSSSEPDSKIDFEDSDFVIMEKLRNAFSVDGEEVVEIKQKSKKKIQKSQLLSNCLLALLKYIIFP